MSKLKLVTPLTLDETESVKTAETTDPEVNTEFSLFQLKVI
jgi:hypothetical protein